MPQLRQLQDDLTTPIGDFVMRAACQPLEDEESAASYKTGIAETTKHKNALLLEAQQTGQEIAQLEAGLGDDEFVSNTVRAVRRKLEERKNPTLQEKRAMIELLDVQCQLVREHAQLDIKGTYVLSDEPFSIPLDEKGSPIASNPTQTN